MYYKELWGKYVKQKREKGTDTIFQLTNKISATLVRQFLWREA